MARLIVRNVGPIKDVDIELRKVNVFMGPQGCGKSTLAKIISFCSWLEKDSDATMKAETGGLVSLMMKFHRMEGYFQDESELAYIGDDVAFFYHFPEPFPLNWKSDDFAPSHFRQDEFIFHKAQRSVNPKVIYIPAERNFVSVVPNLQKYAEQDDSLQSFVNDWFVAKKAYTEKQPLKIEMLGIEYYYSSKTDSDIVVMAGQKIRLSQSSSGFQSVVPLMALLSYLSSTIYEENKPFSPAENEQMREILSRVSSEAKDGMEQKLIDRMAHIWQHKGHIETIGAKGQYTAVSEKQCLDQQGDGNSQTGCIRSEQNGDQRSADSMSCGSSRKRYIEHHGDKGKSGAHAQHRYFCLRHVFFHRAHRMHPYRHHGSRHHAACGQAQIILRNMHNSTAFPASIYSRSPFSMFKYYQNSQFC